MKKIIVYEEKEFKMLPLAIVEKIIEYSKKPYGIQFVSRETGKLLDDLTIQGSLLTVILRVLNQEEK